MKSDYLRVLDKETDTQEVKCLAQDYAANTRRRGDLVESLNGLPSLVKVNHGVCVGGERQTHVLSPLDGQRDWHGGQWKLFCLQKKRKTAAERQSVPPAPSGLQPLGALTVTWWSAPRSQALLPTPGGGGMWGDLELMILTWSGEQSSASSPG